jgi:hypothetical protein
MKNRIITLPIALRSDVPIRGTSRCVSEVNPVRRAYRITLDLTAAVGAQIVVAPDPGFVVAGVTCAGQAVAADATVRLAAGASRIVVETVSELFRSPLDAFAQFPFGDAGVVLPEAPAEREEAAARMIRDFVEVRLKTSLKPGSSADGPAIRIGRPADGRKRGVTVTGNVLTITGADPFDTQQITWDLLRFLDRYDDRFTPTHALLYAGGNASTTAMLKKAGLIKRWVRAVEMEPRLAWNGFAKPERPAKAAVVRPEDLRTLTVPSLDPVPALDGRLDEDVWRRAAVADGFTVMRTGATPTQPTEVRVFRTADALLVGFTCHEANMERILTQQTERDSRVWLDDTFELRLAPGIDGRQAKYRYFIFLVTPIGTKADIERGGSELAWNAEWEAAVYKAKTFWSGELRIPLDALDNTHVPVWRVNFSRTENPNAEFSTWSPIPESQADQPARFGIMRME